MLANTSIVRLPKWSLLPISESSDESVKHFGKRDLSCVIKDKENTGLLKFHHPKHEILHPLFEDFCPAIVIVDDQGENKLFAA
jgi:hypothetical protein